MSSASGYPSSDKPASELTPPPPGPGPGEPVDPKFHIWLGDGWPGPYVVTVTTKLRAGRLRTIVVHGATDMADAVRRAQAALPQLFDETDSLTVTNALDVAADGTVVPPTEPPESP